MVGLVDGGIDARCGACLHWLGRNLLLGKGKKMGGILLSIIDRWRVGRFSEEQYADGRYVEKEALPRFFVVVVWCVVW